MVWLGERRGYLVDWLTQRWVQLTGQRMLLTSAAWLSGPCGATRGIDADFFERWGEARGMTVIPPQPDDGLFRNLGVLDGPAFKSAEVHPTIDDFYARTAAFDLQIRSHWSGPFRPFGWLISRVFARRLAQLNLPVSDHELSGGVSSCIVRLADSEGQVLHCGWVRTSMETGVPVFVGQYGTATVPGYSGTCVKVVFPLPNGNAIVILRPRLDADGGLSFISDGSRFGDPGFYFTVRTENEEVYVRYVRTMKESLSLRVQGDVIEADHNFAVFGLPFLKLNYHISLKTRLETNQAN